MAAYPTLPWMRAGTTSSRASGVEPVRASNGVLKVRRLFDADKLDLQLEHWLSPAQKTTLDDFYLAQRDFNVTVTAPDDGAAYTMRFADVPQYEWRVGYWVARVRLLEV